MSPLLLGRRIALHPPASTDARLANTFFHRARSPAAQRTQDLLVKINPTAQQRPIIETQLSYFPPARNKRPYVSDDILAKIFRGMLKLAPTEETLNEITGLLPLFSKKGRTSLLDNEIPHLLKLKRADIHLFIKEAGRIIRHIPLHVVTQPVPSLDAPVPKSFPRSEFLSYIYEILDPDKRMPVEDIFSALLQIRKKKSAGWKFMPPEALFPFSYNHLFHLCEFTEPFFKKAFLSGTLVQTTAEIDGVQKTVYVKGFWSDTGNPLAYDPSTNCVYAFRMESGKITEAKPAYDIRNKGYNGTELQVLFKNAHP